MIRVDTRRRALHDEHLVELRHLEESLQGLRGSPDDDLPTHILELAVPLDHQSKTHRVDERQGARIDLDPLPELDIVEEGAQIECSCSVEFTSEPNRAPTLTSDDLRRRRRIELTRCGHLSPLPRRSSERSVPSPDDHETPSSSSAPDHSLCHATTFLVDNVSEPCAL